MAGETIRYLEAKRSIDDRSLSRRVRETLCGQLPVAPTVFEAGCGTGASVPRLLEWGVSGTYTGIDTKPRLIHHARKARPAELRRRGYALTETATGCSVADLTVSYQSGDALDAAGDSARPDLILAQQFFDLVDIERAVTAFTDALPPGGLLYAPLTFDGVSLFEPAHPLDQEMMAAYHATIDEREGTSRAGRTLVNALGSQPGTVLAVDASDAIVRPRNGVYPADEQFVLDCILSAIDDEVSSEDVPGRTDWLDTRRQQLQDGSLLYVAHRYDLLYRA